MNDPSCGRSRIWWDDTRCEEEEACTTTIIACTSLLGCHWCIYTTRDRFLEIEIKMGDAFFCVSMGGGGYLCMCSRRAAAPPSTLTATYLSSSRATRFVWCSTKDAQGRQETLIARRSISLLISGASIIYTFKDIIVVRQLHRCGSWQQVGGMAFRFAAFAFIL